MAIHEPMKNIILKIKNIHKKSSKLFYVQQLRF